MSTPSNKQPVCPLRHTLHRLQQTGVREVTLAFCLEQYLRTHGLRSTRLCPNIRQGDDAPTPEEVAALDALLNEEEWLDVALDWLACRHCLR